MSTTKFPVPLPHVSVRIMSECTNIPAQFGTLVGVGAACRDAEQALRSAGLRCGNKQTYSFSVREPRRSELRPFFITHFNTILLTFHGWFRQMGMRPRTVLLLRRSLSAQSLRLMAVAHCGLRLTNSLNVWHTHILEKLIIPYSVKKFPAFCETRSFVTPSTTACDLPLCFAKCVAMNPKLYFPPPPPRILTSCRIQCNCNIRLPSVGLCMCSCVHCLVPLRYYKPIVSSQCALRTPPISYCLI